MQTPPLPKLVLYALSFVLAIALIFAASTTTAAFGGYNVQWDGTSEFRTLADQQSESHVALDTTAYDTDNANDTVAIVVAPTESYTDNESRRIRSFVERGGTLVVADDFGTHGNTILSAVGATARFNGTQLRDEQNYYRAPSLPIASNVTESPYTTAVEQLTLNGGTAVDPGSATPIATTSEFAYLDRNGTGNLSATDELGQYPVVTSEPVGSGTVVTVGDPSLFINTMLSQPDNRAFATALVETREQTLLDYSKMGGQPPLAVVLLVFRSSQVAQLILGIIGVGTIWGYTHSNGVKTDTKRRLETLLPEPLSDRIPRWMRGPVTDQQERVVDDAAVLASLQNAYPELDESQLERMMTDVLSEQSREEADE